MDDMVVFLDLVLTIVYFLTEAKTCKLLHREKISLKMIYLFGEDDGYLIHSCSDIAFKGTFVNRTYHFLN